jgi:hypothetical protein
VKDKLVAVLLSLFGILMIVFLFAYLQNKYGNIHGDMSYDDYVQYSSWFVPM